MTEVIVVSTYKGTAFPEPFLCASEQKSEELVKLGEKCIEYALRNENISLAEQKEIYKRELDSTHKLLNELYLKYAGLNNIKKTELVMEDIKNHVDFDVDYLHMNWIINISALIKLGEIKGGTGFIVMGLGPQPQGN
jgi:hypothetical protein|tara:strand:+ start:83 stop:493 length:411 start_codon:yes stop_codon:yes gene_type:complete